MASIAQIKKAFGQTQNAFIRLKEAISYHDAPEIKEDAVIQRFEFTYELLWKCFKRIAKMEKIEVYSPKSSFQAAFKMGLIKDEAIFLEMIDARNRTTHIYSQDEAHQIYMQIVDIFSNQIKKTLSRIETWLASND